jgi:hypothetical protein
VLEYFKKKHRLICQTSPEQLTETCHDHMWSSNNSTMPLRITTRRQSSLLSHWHKRPHRLTKKMIDWSKYCSSGGLLAFARISFSYTMRNYGHSWRVTLDTSLHRGRNGRRLLVLASCGGMSPMRTRSSRGLGLSLPSWKVSSSTRPRLLTEYQL